MRLSVALAAVWLTMFAANTALAKTLRVVAVGASNTWGWGVKHGEAYPERLQALLRARGIDAHVKNAGVNFSTTRGMLERLDSVVADGTHIVIIEPGRNDVRFFSTPARRATRIQRMVERVQQRGMKPIIYEPDYAPGDFQWDHIHLTPKAHAKIANDLVPKVLATMPKHPPERTSTAPKRR